MPTYRVTFPDGSAIDKHRRAGTFTHAWAHKGQKPGTRDRWFLGGFSSSEALAQKGANRFHHLTRRPVEVLPVNRID